MSKLYRKKKFKNRKQINVGLQILRMICCLLIILTHFYSFRRYRILLNEHKYYLMTFFFLSFYFSYNTFTSRNVKKIKERFKRMLIPYIGWPLMFFIKDKLYHYMFKTKQIYNWKDLYYQILFGLRIYGIFWFLFTLLFLSLFFTLIIFIFKTRFNLVLFIICIIDYSLIYSNYAYKHFFIKYKKIPVHYSIKEIFYYLNFAFSGFYLASKYPLKKLIKNRFKLFAISCFYLYIFFKYYFSFFKKIHFFFQPISKNIFILNLFLFFGMIPFDKIKNKVLMEFLIKVTSYTGGVFYLHAKMGFYLGRYFFLIRTRTFKGCLIIYFICYLTCLIGTFVFRKNSLKNLFI